MIEACLLAFDDVGHVGRIIDVMAVAAFEDFFAHRHGSVLNLRRWRERIAWPTDGFRQWTRLLDVFKFRGVGRFGGFHRFLRLGRLDKMAVSKPHKFQFVRRTAWVKRFLFALFLPWIRT